MTMSEKYDIEKVRTLLEVGFGQEDLVALCQVRFSTLLRRRLELNSPKGKIISVLLEYAKPRDEIHVILDWVREHDDKIYRKFQPFKEIERKFWMDWITQETPSTTQIVENAAKVCELLRSYYDNNTWHQTLQTSCVFIDETGNPYLDSLVKTGTVVDPQADSQGLGSLLFLSLTGADLPLKQMEKEAALVKVEGIPPSLVRLILRATNNPPNWPDNHDPLSWAALLRATQQNTLLVDQLSPNRPWTLKEALELVIVIGNEIQSWRRDGISYLLPSSELIEL